MEATLVIDVDIQDGWKDRINSQEIRQKNEVGKRIRNEIESVRERGGCLCFVMLVPRRKYVRFGTHFQIPDGRNRSDCCIVCNADNIHHVAKFLRHRHKNINEPAFIKCEKDAFSNSHLAPFLRSRGATSVRLMGCARSICVYETALGALKNGFRVVLLSDCIYHPFANDDEETEWLEELRSKIPEEMREKIPREVTREANDDLLLRVIGTR